MAQHEDDFTEYARARQPALLRTAYLLSGDPHTAEDLVQTTLAKLYLAWPKVEKRESVDGYVRRILVNEHVSLWRRPWRRNEVTSTSLPEPADDRQPDDGTRAVVWQFVRSLPPRQRAVVVLRYYEELTEAETAEVLGISVGTVKSQASRALATLRRQAPPDLAPTRPTHDLGEEER
ncbi:SigE family RNA polymerase sigma factor [Nocardioides limicola]|uniref:SigE family RNA polymerase sigma factor n=1 Tax=Nocardioides limicola TaxID=2803368 RepID=UPI00193C68FD|nr:SigE family RNA polymerase sigma factor [Nocardioides sp. DJM-14]